MKASLTFNNFWDPRIHHINKTLKTEWLFVCCIDGVWNRKEAQILSRDRKFWQDFYAWILLIGETTKNCIVKADQNLYMML